MGDAVFTAGAYVFHRGRVAFMVGPTPAGDRLGVVRLGGHAEAGETGWACAAREVAEEASMRVTPLRPPQSYWVDMAREPQDLLPADSAGSGGDAIVPIVRSRRTDGRRSELYLAQSDDPPVPAAESCGLLLLDRANLSWLLGRPSTLRRLVAGGSKLLLRRTLSLDLPLQPFPQVVWLQRLLELHPQLPMR